MFVKVFYWLQIATQVLSWDQTSYPRPLPPLLFLLIYNAIIFFVGAKSRLSCSSIPTIYCTIGMRHNILSF